MRLGTIVGALVALVVIVLVVLPTPAVQQDNVGTASAGFVLGPVQVFDGHTKLDVSYIEVRDGRIAKLHQQAPNTNLPLIDGQQQWLMPGLIDAHVHAWGNALEAQLARGVTTVVDMFGDPSYLQVYQQFRTRAQPQRHADIWGAGYLVTAPGGHGTQYGLSVPVMHSVDDADAMIQQRLAQGADFIKVVYTHANAVYDHHPSISLAQLQALVAAAKRHEVMIVAHIADHQSALDAVKAGVDGLVHSFFDQLASDELLQELRANEVFIIPTLVVYEGILRQQVNAQYLLENTAFELNANVRQQLQSRFPVDLPERYYGIAQQTIQRMHAAGVPILVGSDAPNPNTAHGWSMAMEMLLLAEAGVPTEAVLAGATVLPAKHFALGQRGRIAEGYRADFLLLKNDPRSDLTTLIQPQAIYKNGVRYQP